MYMWLLRFHGRDELCQMALSTDVEKLKKKAEEELGKKLKFPDYTDVIFIHEMIPGKGVKEIGIIGKVEVL